MSVRKDASPVRKLCITGLMMALSVIIGILCKNLMTWNIYYRVTFENFPVILTGFCFGPLWGMAAGAGADLVSCLCSSNPVVNPIITAGAASVGLCAGLIPLLAHRFFYAGKTNIKRKGRLTLALSVAFAHLFGQVLIKSIGKIVFYGMPAVGILFGAGISAIVGTAEYFILLLLLRNPEIVKILKGMTDYELQ